MTREEFVAKFKVKDKIRYNDWDDDSWIEIKYFGIEFFVGYDPVDGDMTYEYDDYDLGEFSKYKKPKENQKNYAVIDGVTYDLVKRG